ncbi:solute carrier family 12 member 9-like [Crotalus adamanteus]|uniref:Solute carrier family 12 member 9 n=1 Tax=Crotalus adamanteus TaxID=8729 RepID=A0AAW1BIA9_CROAD
MERGELTEKRYGRKPSLPADDAPLGLASPDTRRQDWGFHPTHPPPVSWERAQPPESAEKGREDFLGTAPGSLESQPGLSRDRRRRSGRGGGPAACAPEPSAGLCARSSSGDHARSSSLEADQALPTSSRKLSTFLGVVVPTLLSMFSVVLFLRLGFVVGQAGLYQSLAMFLVAYFIIGMTVLSVCAISTNGALDAGGAYYMISRALGPEFGGSIGIMFFFANVCGSALYILGLVEAMMDDFGSPAEGTIGSATQVLPRGYWFDLLYATVLLFLCLLVCLVGAGIYAKATFLIFLIVMVVLGTVCLSFFVVSVQVVRLPAIRDGNHTELINASFTGFKLSTLLDNLHADYSVDYTTGRLMSFSTVFAVMFNGCTGIMAGSNMSGDLKRPSYSIPRGTIMAVMFTYIVYNLLAVLLSCTCDSDNPSEGKVTSDTAPQAKELGQQRAEAVPG